MSCDELTTLAPVYPASDPVLGLAPDKDKRAQKMDGCIWTVQFLE